MADRDADFQLENPSLVPMPFSRRASPICRMVDGKAMGGPEMDPMKAYVNTPQPRRNVWSADDDPPVPSQAPVGPAVVSVVGTKRNTEQYQKRDAEFLGRLRTGTSSQVFFYFSSFRMSDLL